MLAFAAEAIGGPGDDEFPFGIAESDRTLRSTMAESIRGAILSEAVGYGVRSVLIAVDDHSQPEVNDMLQREIKLPCSMT
jgi:hypothetical protein